jgi:hypothetical protein
VAGPIAIGIAVFLSELAPGGWRRPLSFLTELLAAIPSIVYGLWGVFVLVPLIRKVETGMPESLRKLPIFSGPPVGVGMLAAAAILAIMVIPFSSAVAREVLRAAHDARALPILDQLTHRIDAHVAEIEVTLRSGDELGVMNFLKADVEPLFDHLQTFGDTVRERIDAYRTAVDPAIGLVYARRKEFDESVTAINEAVSAYIDLEEQAAQGMFPHYFEKQKTDGVDYTIYVGGALREDGVFDPLYLKNLRLWQLMVACGVALRVERLKDRLPVMLDITNLILIQHAPLSIRFRFDEKRFDVDGAYNVRYEIIKKRIDKAIIRGTTERLTQPGKIALVYSHATEASEWREYIEYLQRLGYLTPDVEEVELDELQGAQGLRALRVTVDLANRELDLPSIAGSLPRAEGERAPAA